MKKILLLVVTLCLTTNFLIAQFPTVPIQTNTSGEPTQQTLQQLDLISHWQSAGYSTTFLPTATCINIKSITGSGKPVSGGQQNDGFHVSLDDLSNYINNHSANYLHINFPTDDYVVSKCQTLSINRPNVSITGDSKSTIIHVKAMGNCLIEDPVQDVIVINSGSHNTTLGCFEINTEVVLPYFHPSHKPQDPYNLFNHGRVVNKTIIRFKNTNNCIAQGISIKGGYGSSFSLDNSSHITVHGCQTFRHWTHGGGSGTQGYAVNLDNSNHCKIENNVFEQQRHGVVIQFGSQYNVVAYNSVHGSWARNVDTFLGLIWVNLELTWDITLHGGENVGEENKYNLIEGNFCEDKIAADKQKQPRNSYMNVFYRNRAFRFEIQTKDNCSYNERQVMIGNHGAAFLDAYQIKARRHTLYENENASHTAPSRLGRCNGANRQLNVSATVGSSCYLTTRPSWYDNSLSFPSIGRWNVLQTNPAHQRQDIYGSCGFVSCPFLYPTRGRTSGARTTTAKVFPNPFTRQTTLTFDLPQEEALSIILYDIMGRQVRTIAAKEFFTAGEHQLAIERNDLVKGVYFVMIQGTTTREKFKLIIQ